jgi:hypothetical protein
VQRLVGCKVRHSGGVRHSVTGYVTLNPNYRGHSARRGSTTEAIQHAEPYNEYI